MSDALIHTFLSEFPRNRIVLSNHGLNGFEYFDVGYELANHLRSSGITDVSYDMINDFETLIGQSVIKSETFGEVLAIQNLGFLMEKKLNFNLRSFLDRMSQTRLVVVKWDGEIDGNSLYLLTKGSGLKIDLNGLNYLLIE